MAAVQHRRALILVALTLVLGACFRTDASSTVGADGAAATHMRIDLDIGAIEAIFGGLADSFGEEGQDQPGIREQLETSFEEFDEQLDDLYAENPGLRDRFRLQVSFDDDILRTEIHAFTEEIEHLGDLYESVLGTGDTDLSEIFDVPPGSLSGADDEMGSGSGIFSEVTTGLDDEFRFHAETGGSGQLGGTGDLGGELFEGLEPEVVISITAPGEVRETNGEVDGRTVTWELDGTGSEDLELRSAVDDSVTVDGIDTIAATGADGDGFPVVPVAVVGVLVLAGLVAWVAKRRSRAGDGGTDDVASAPPPDAGNAGTGTAAMPETPPTTEPPRGPHPDDT